MKLTKPQILIEKYLIILYFSHKVYVCPSCFFVSSFFILFNNIYVFDFFVTLFLLIIIIIIVVIIVCPFFVGIYMYVCVRVNDFYTKNPVYFYFSPFLFNSLILESFPFFFHGFCLYFSFYSVCLCCIIVFSPSPSLLSCSLSLYFVFLKQLVLLTYFFAIFVYIFSLSLVFVFWWHLLWFLLFSF